MNTKHKFLIAGAVCIYVALSWLLFVQLNADMQSRPGETLPQVIRRMDCSWAAGAWLFGSMLLAGFGCIMAGTYPGWDE